MAEGKTVGGKVARPDADLPERPQPVPTPVPDARIIFPPPIEEGGGNAGPLSHEHG